MASPGLTWIQDAEHRDKEFSRFLSIIPFLDTLIPIQGSRFFDQVEYFNLNTNTSYDVSNTKPICCDDNCLFVMRYEKYISRSQSLFENIALVMFSEISICSIDPYTKQIVMSTGEIVLLNENMKPGLACMLYQVVKTVIELDDRRILREKLLQDEKNEKIERIKKSFSILDVYGT